MRFNPRTGLYELDPGDVGYDPSASDAGTYMTNMGLPYSYAQSQTGQPPPPQQPQGVDVTPYGTFEPYDSDFDELMQAIPTTQQDQFTSSGRLISEFQDVPVGAPVSPEGIVFKKPTPGQLQQEQRTGGYMGQDPTPGLPGDPAPGGPVIGGIQMNEDFMERLYDVTAQGRVDQEVAGIDAALGDPLSLQGTPTAAPTVTETAGRSLAATPERTADAGALDDPRKKQLNRQLGVAAAIGGIQALVPVIQRFTDPTIREAQKTKDEFVEGQAGQEVYEESMGAGRAAISRQAALSRQVQEDIAASSGVTDVRRQEQIRDAAADAFTKEEAELEANARQLAARAEEQALGEFRSALAYLSQANNAMAQGTMQALSAFAPVAAALDVNDGFKVYSKDIANLPEEFQDMFYALSANAKSKDEIARVYALVNRRAATAQNQQQTNQAADQTIAANTQ